MTTDVVVRGLAVVGGGVLGGLGAGLLAQLVARAFLQKMPRWAAVVVRVVGGAACGMLLALWLFGGEGPGIGGRGGWGLGSGPGKGEGEGEKNHEVSHVGPDGPPADADRAPPGATLRVEVLGDEPLRKMKQDAAHRYRLADEEAARLLTLDEVKEVIRQRRQKQPPLRRLEIVLYKDSPDEKRPQVGRLRAWARELDDGKFRADVLKKPGTEAPVK